MERLKRIAYTKINVRERENEGALVFLDFENERNRRESRRREKKHAKTAEKKGERGRVIYQISRKESNSKKREGKRVRQWEREALTFGVCF